MERGKREERNVKWILIISLIMFFVLKWWDYVFPYAFFDLWFLIYFINILSVVLTIIFAALSKAGFWETEIIYQLTIFFFILSMSLLLVSQFQLILRVIY